MNLITGKVVCNINKFSDFVTENKIYYVKRIYGLHYILINDQGDEDVYHHTYFTPIKEYRNNKLGIILK